ncbi:MATE family efflux transporter [Herbaspirillum huttiense]|uniref:MATE family efflux transporter n=1 Tax=Herbaspirillum huttiense TaxID=863372 RepID=UPI001066889F|nr:MATE family efflux transporter [Herbaspirillum huttiense]QBP74258.1 MATE family efflux transporter [Herbaspirillum huttiense]
MTTELPALSSRHHVGRITRLAWPLLIGQLAIIANGVIDTAMVSRFSALDLGALALGVSIYVSVFVGLSGVLQALQPTIGQLYGAGRVGEIGNEVKQGMWLAVLLSIVGSLILMFSPLFLAVAKASPELVEKATLYLRIEALALPATLFFRVYSSLNTALARPKMVMALQLGGLLLKLPLNALLIFGGLGLPAFGGPGCAIATTLIAWLMMIAAWLLVARLPLYRPLKLFGSGFVAPSWKSQRTLLLLGIPIGMSYFIEVTAFTLMAVFIARLGAVPVAGHQIAANVGTVLYMLPLSIASATSTLVAQAIGGGNMAEARKIGRAGIRLAVSLSVVIGVIVWFLREHIIRAYTPDPVIVGAALPLFLYIAFYQLFDSMQVTTAFVLRAYKVAVVPTVIYAVTLWGVGLGGGYLLGLDPLGVAPPALRGPSGFWLANSLSLGLVALGLLAYLRVIQRRAQRGELSV